MSDTISVIVPVYKVEQYLDDCIQSLINQTYQYLEIILVDDGSPDNCGKICDHYAEVDNRVRVIHKENGGVSDARNVGIREASGKYIGFVDSDDYVDKYFYEYLMKLAKKYDADIVECCSISFVDEILPHAIEDERIKVLNPKQWLTETNLEDFFASVFWNKIYKKDIFQDITCPVGRHYEDEAVIYQLVYRANKIVRGKSALYFYRQRKNSITDNEKNIEETVQRFTALYEKCLFFKEHEEPELEEFSYSKLMIFLISAFTIWNNDDFEKKNSWISILKNNESKVLHSKVVPLKYKLYIKCKLMSMKLFGRV